MKNYRNKFFILIATILLGFLIVTNIGINETTGFLNLNSVEYKDAIDALDNLTKGTQEYRDALDEANQKALELIQNNPDKFTKDDYYWDNDKLVIKDTAMSRVAEASRQETADLYAASTMANANNAQA